MTIKGLAWSSWSPCLTSCGFDGKEMRHQLCEPSWPNFVPCLSEERPCDQMPCPGDNTKAKPKLE